jgi:hypothetical protein
MHYDEKKTIPPYAEESWTSRPELYASMHVHAGIMDRNLVFPQHHPLKSADRPAQSSNYMRPTSTRE